jgi:glycosyltransferase involved in cell wall biosynthesis
MTRPLCIAMVAACPFPASRGTPIRIYRMAEALARSGHEVHVVTYHLGQGGAEAPFHIHRVPVLKFYRRLSPGPSFLKLLLLDPLLTRVLFQVLRAKKFDLVHAHHYEGLLTSLAVRPFTKHPVIYDAHTLLESELPSYGPALPAGAKRTVGRWLDRRLPRRAAHVIAVTEELRSKLIGCGGVEPENISVVQNGVELDHFDPSHSNVVRNGAKKTLIFTGNLGPYQGIPLLLQILQAVVRRRDDVQLSIVSDSDFEPFDSQARQLGVRGHISVRRSNFQDLPKFLAGADLALNPRIDCDGYPQKLLNYMAAGKPIVSFEGSAKNLRHRETGWIVKDGDVDGFAEGILSLLANKEMAERLGNNARQLVRSDFSWERTAQLAEAVYERVLKQASAGWRGETGSVERRPV